MFVEYCGGNGLENVSCVFVDIRYGILYAMDVDLDVEDYQSKEKIIGCCV